MYQDPFQQILLFIGVEPVFRMLHSDKNNLSLWAFTLLSIYSQYMTYYWFGLFTGLFALTGWTIKTYLTCGHYYNYYKNRTYGSSKLVVDESGAVLYLEADNSYDNGYEYGVILCEEIMFLIRRFKSIVKPKIPAYILMSIDNKLSKDIRDEITGMFDAIECMYPGKITYWDILTCQLIPEISRIGCTGYARYDKAGHVVFGRNLDWMPFSSAHYSIIVNYKKHGYSSLVVPGLVGCLTAWNSKYVLAMNVVGLERKLDYNLLPSTLFNKNLMIRAKTLESANNIAAECLPASPYHLTIVSRNNATCYSYYQGPDETTYKRELSGEKSMSILNWTYPDNNNGRFISNIRNEWIEAAENTLFEDESMSAVDSVIHVIKECQTFITMQSVLFRYTIDELNINIAIDNGYAVDKFAGLVNQPMYGEGGSGDVALEKEE